MRVIKIDPLQPAATYTLEELTRDQMVTLSIALKQLSTSSCYVQVGERQRNDGGGRNQLRVVPAEGGHI